MRLHSTIPYLIAAAGLVQVSGSPIRIVTTDTPDHGAVVFHAIRLGRPAADANLAPISVTVPNIGAAQAGSLGRPSRHHCGKLREKALAISNTFRKALGMPLIKVDEVKFVKISGIHPTPAHQPPHVHHHGHHHRHHHRPGSHGMRMRHQHLMEQPFARRLHFALSSLGPWEGRAVAFVIGCGIGVLLRMLWVLAVITYRMIRGNSSSDGEYQHILFDHYDAEDPVAAPPAFVYVDEKAPIVQVASDKKGEKETETK